MRGRKFSLYREENTEVLVSNWTILGYTLPSIGIFVMLMAFIIEPYMAYWGTLIFAWWLVPIIIISSIVLFIKALKKNGILKRTVLRLSLINLLVFLFLIFVRMPIYNCDAVEMAKHYDRNTEKFDEFTLGRLIKAGDKINERTLTGTGTADNSDGLARPHTE